MTFDGKWRRFPLVGVAALWMLCISVLPSPCLAMPIPSQVAAEAGSSVPRDLSQVQSFLEQKMVRERLQSLGFTPEEINARLAELTPDQLHEVAQKTENLHVGGDFGGALVAIVFILAVVVLILELTGHHVLGM